MTQKCVTFWIFVYGTLKKGQKLDGGEFTKSRLQAVPATTQGVLFDLGVFPAAVFGGESKQIVGEAHQYPCTEKDKVLKALDFIEGFWGDNVATNLYVRKTVQAKTNEGVLECIAYEFADKTALTKTATVLSGEWRQDLIAVPKKRFFERLL